MGISKTFAFLWRHPIPSLVGVLALVLEGLGIWSGATGHLMFDLPPWAWQGLAFFVFVGATVSLLADWEARHHSALDGAPDGQASGWFRWPWKRKIPVVEPATVLGQAPEPAVRPLTREEELYRTELRRFVNQIDSAFRELHGAAQYLFRYPDHQQSDEAVAILRWFYVRALLGPVSRMDAIKEKASAPVELLNGEYEQELRSFLYGPYCELQECVRMFNKSTGLTLRDEPSIKSWLDKERICVEQLKMMKAMPASSALVREQFSPDVFGFLGERWLRAPSPSS